MLLSNAACKNVQTPKLGFAAVQTISVCTLSRPWHPFSWVVFTLFCSGLWPSNSGNVLVCWTFFTGCYKVSTHIHGMQVFMRLTERRFYLEIHTKLTALYSLYNVVEDPRSPRIHFCIWDYITSIVWPCYCHYCLLSSKSVSKNMLFSVFHEPAIIINDSIERRKTCILSQSLKITKHVSSLKCLLEYIWF